VVTMNSEQMETCFCKGNKFYVAINSDTRNHIRLICSKCKCERLVRTPGMATHYTIEPALFGFEIDEVKGTMRRI